ncbi:MAG: TIGR02147 family protein [Bdellovibrionales bacterium]
MKTENFAYKATKKMALKTQPRNFREYLQGEFVLRCKKNPQYSMRAFSKFLGVENSWLSKILRGKKVASRQSIEKLAFRLGLSAHQVQNLQSLSKTNKDSEAAYKVLTEDIFEVISDWFHFAILELMKLDSFEADEKWISKKLGIPFIEARSAIERLKKVGLIETCADGNWIDTSNGFTTHNLGIHFTSAARRRLQENILEKSREALVALPIEERDHSSIMMATNMSKLEEAKRRIDTFRKEICDFLEDCNEKNEVYQLSVGLFPLTKK